MFDRLNHKAQLADQKTEFFIPHSDIEMRKKDYTSFQAT